jgi:hypothetical protein
MESMVGQKVQVTGRAGAAPDRNDPAATGTAGAATGATATAGTSGTAATGSTSAGTTGTSGAPAAATAQLRLDVQSIKTFSRSK